MLFSVKNGGFTSSVLVKPALNFKFDNPFVIYLNVELNFFKVQLFI